MAFVSEARAPWGERFRDFRQAGHLPTLFSAFLYFDFCFAVWVLNGAMAPFISSELKLSPAQTGLLVSVPVLVGAILRLPIGILAQHRGRKFAAMLSTAIIIAGLIIGSLTVDSFTGVLIMGGVLGVGGASFGVAMSLGSGSYPRRYKGLAMGLAGAGNSGAVLAVLFAPPLASAYGWRAVYGLAALPLAVAFVTLWRFAKEPDDLDPNQTLRDYGRLLASRDLWILTLVYAVTFGGYIGLTSFLPTLFHVQYGIPKELVGQYTAGAILAGSMLRVVGGWLADRVGGLRLLRWLGVVIGGFALLAMTFPHPLLLTAILIACFAAMGAGNGAVFQLVPLRFPAVTAVASSLIGEIGALAGGAVPGVMGAARQNLGTFAPGFLLIGALAFVATVALALYGREWLQTWLRPATSAEPAASASTEGSVADAEAA